MNNDMFLRNLKDPFLFIWQPPMSVSGCTDITIAGLIDTCRINRKSYLSREQKQAAIEALKLSIKLYLQLRNFLKSPESIRSLAHLNGGGEGS